MTPLGAAMLNLGDAEVEALVATPNILDCACWAFGIGSIERVWDVGIPALSTSVAEVLRVRSVLFQVSPVD